MPKIKELLDFKEIKDVIDLDSDIGSVDDKKNIIRDYIISERLKTYIIELAENISKPSHKSTQIIGGYGSGKSHLLAWIVSLLENHELVEDIGDEDVKKKFTEALQRDFAVVQFELQPGSSPLSDFFYDRVEQQLKDKHNIIIPDRDPSRPDDFKRDINNIVNKIKEKNPTMGFVVVIDEISDFLKQKTKQQINRDIQFLRILGQVSQSIDFLFIGSMQENVFSNPIYVDEAESFGRVSERFDIVTILREDIEKVISKRVLKKDVIKRNQLDSIFSEYKKEFPPINTKADLYIDLFPIHPYVIKIFNELPYFEKRGVIQFTIDRVKEILDCEFPKFITYDNVFDEMNAKHTIRNLDEVHPVIEAIESLESKLDLLERDKQEDARKLIKALAVLKLYGKTNNNGATPEELANQLLITSNRIKNTDKILLILDKVREVTSGQFITKTADNYFYLNLEQTIDYDEVIKRKIGNLPEGLVEEELLNIIKYTDLINAQQAESYERTFLDTATWPEKKSFRIGHFIFDDGSDQVKKGELDFNLVVLSPYKTSSKLLSSKQTAILQIPYSDELDNILKELAATRIFISEGYAKSIMEKKRYEYKKAAKGLLLKIMLDLEIEQDGVKRKVKSVILEQPENIDEFFHYLKTGLFSEQFSIRYNKYPKFYNLISFENIKGEVETTIKEIFQKGEGNLFTNAKNILSSLDLIDMNGNIDTEDSIFVKVILEELNQEKGKNVKIDELIAKLSNPPFGLNIEMTQLALIVLTYSGQINLKKRGGGTLTSSDLSDVFKNGLDSFRDIPYATLETEFPVDAIVKLFKILNINPGLIRNPKDRTKAVQEFRSNALKLKETLESNKRGLEELSKKPDSLLDKDILQKEAEELENFPIADFLAVNTVSDFKKVEYNDMEIAKVKKYLDLILRFNGFLEDYYSFIYKEYLYMKNALGWLKNYPDIFPKDEIAPMVEIYSNCTPFISDIINLLDAEKRRILKGKLQQFKQKYIPLYYNKHSKTVGNSIKWSKLDTNNQSKELKWLRNLKAIRCINPLELNKLDNQILSISRIMCTELLDDHLKDNYICPNCRFPETLGEFKDINQEIENIEITIDIISQEWTKTILDEIENYKDNINLLSASEQNIIELIRSEKKIPKEIDQNLIAALNNLFSELKEIEVTPKQLFDFIFSENSVLDYETFSQKLEEYKAKILDIGDRKNIRIKVRND